MAQAPSSTGHSSAWPPSGLPAWLNHFNTHDLKTLFRCWTAAWVASLLIFIGPSLHSIGIATFFAALVLYIVPPAGILFVYLLASLSLLFGMCLAWAWGLLTMKAAQAARPTSQTNTDLQALQTEAATLAKQSGQNPSAVATGLVHEGFMLDARVTAIFYVLSCVFIYALSRARVANPKFILVQLFGIIVLDLFLLIGPTLPSFTPKLAQVLVEPGAIGIGLGAVCCLLLFPQSTAYVVLDSMEKLVRVSKVPLQCTEKRLGGEEVHLDGMQGTKDKMIAIFKAVQPALGFLPLDVSRGRWNADDVKGLYPRVREVMLASVSLLDFLIARKTAETRMEELDARSQSSNGDEKGPQAGNRQLLESADLMHALKSPEQGVVRDRTIQALRSSTAEVLQLCSECIGTVAETVHTVNTRRWIRTPAQAEFDQLSENIATQLESLRRAQKACVTNTTEGVIDSHRDLFDDKGQLKSEGVGPHALRGIVLSMVIEERILSMTVATEQLLSHILQLVQSRRSHRIWLPSRLQDALSWLLNSESTIPVSGSPTSEPDPDTVQQSKEAHRQFRRSLVIRPPRRGLLNRLIVGSYRWLTSTGGMYALRMVIVTIATSIPAAIPHSAGFFYREKGIWGVITAQTTLLPYLADFTFSMIARLVGTVIGGVLGMVAWYIGSGHGGGNAYGMAAITGAMTVVLMWWRIFLPPAYAQATIMGGATFVLVIGFSYDDTHIAQYGLPGHGYEAFWKRLVTVLLGFVASTVVQLFPRPPSATRHICKTLSNAVRALADQYALLLSTWGGSSDNVSGGMKVGVIAEQVALDMAETLLSLRGSISLLKFEVSFGPFDHKVLFQVRSLLQEMNQALARLLVLSTTLPAHLQARLTHTVGILDPKSIGEVMAVLGVIEQALKTGDALPERLPTPLVSRCFEQWKAKHRTAELSVDLVREESYRRYCCAVGGYLKFLAVVDELVLVLKGGLGEAHVVWMGEDGV